MGMTIDEAINTLEYIKNNPTNDVDAQLLPEAIELFDTAIETMRKYQQLEDFAKWVATEVIDEELWTYNHLAFAELACRKLVKLGIMQESDGEYSYEVIEDGKID